MKSFHASCHDWVTSLNVKSLLEIAATLDDAGNFFDIENLALLLSAIGSRFLWRFTLNTFINTLIPLLIFIYIYLFYTMKSL